MSLHERSVKGRQSLLPLPIVRSCTDPNQQEFKPLARAKVKGIVARRDFVETQKF
jgi:hypothetical protein